MPNIAISYYFTLVIYPSSTVNICCCSICLFDDALSITIIILSHRVTEVSAILFKYLLFSQVHVLGFQL